MTPPQSTTGQEGTEIANVHAKGHEVKARKGEGYHESMDVWAQKLTLGGKPRRSQNQTPSYSGPRRNWGAHPFPGELPNCRFLGTQTTAVQRWMLG